MYVAGTHLRQKLLWLTILLLLLLC
jgi:hypothetical protein